MATQYQTYGALYFYDNKLTDVPPPDVSREMRNQEEAKKRAQLEADKRYMEQMRKRRAQLEQEGLEDAVKRSEWSALNREIEATQAASDELGPIAELNETLGSARTWLRGGRLSNLGTQALLGGALFKGLGLLVEHGGVAYKALHHGHHLMEAKKAGTAVTVMVEGFPPINSGMSAGQIREYGQRLQQLTGLEGAQVTAEGRQKLARQVEAAARAREKRDAALREAIAARNAHAAAIRAARAHGVFVAR